MTVSAIFANLAETFLINIRLFGVTLLLGIPLGLLISFGTMSKLTPLGFLLRNKHAALRVISRFRPVAWITKMFVWIVRGTPLMLQIIIFFYGPGLIGMNFSWGSGYTGRFNACAVAFIINYACYFSEIFRGGIESMPFGQKEAGQALGMTRTQIFLRITLLQVIKRIVPPMGNEIITLVKDTSLARVIANPEIIFAAQTLATSNVLIWPLFSTALFFLAAVGLLTLLLGAAEKKLSYFR